MFSRKEKNFGENPDKLLQPLAVSGYLRFRQKRTQPHSEMSLLHSRQQLPYSLPSQEHPCWTGDAAAPEAVSTELLSCWLWLSWVVVLVLGEGIMELTRFWRELPVISSWIFTRGFHLLVEKTFFFSLFRTNHLPEFHFSSWKLNWSLLKL